MNSSKVFFSVIIPCFNVEDTINKTIISVLNQDFIQYEIIAVNDGSIDNTSEILNSYYKSNLIKVLNQENKGLGAARNAGIKHALGEYICLLDADDIWTSNKLSKLYSFIKKNSSKIISNDEIILEEKYLFYLRNKPPENLSNLLLVGNTLSPSAMTYCSTVFSIIEANLKPVLIDIGYLSSTLNIKELKKKISKKTKVIIPVHLYGSVADLKEIRKLIKNRNIYLIDDCAQAHGAYEDGSKPYKKIGSGTDISCFSLYPGKNLGAYGDAGIITTNNINFYKRLRKLRNLGSEEKFNHELVGMNSRLDTIQAIVLNEKLKNLNIYNHNRNKIAKFYDKNIRNPKIQKIKYSKYCVYHQYVILVEKRDRLIGLLDKKKIQYGFHYPKAIHQLGAFKKQFNKKRFKNAEKIAENSISLPIDPNLNRKQLKEITQVLNKF